MKWRAWAWRGLLIPELLLHSRATVLGRLFVIPALETLLHELFKPLSLFRSQNLAHPIARFHHLPANLRLDLLAGFLNPLLTFGHDTLNLFALFMGEAKFPLQEDRKLATHELGWRIALNWGPYFAWLAKHLGRGHALGGLLHESTLVDLFHPHG
ncbi:MAG: hypothetical protein HOP33_22530 [Verrucomicrobia bacterium]|nr:hypothetical protein [Verrucomicrobiota bacterium]